MNNVILTVGATILLALTGLLHASEQGNQQQAGASDMKQNGSGLQRMSPEERRRFNDDLQNHSGTVYPDHEQIESRRQIMRQKMQERLQRADTDHDNSLSRTEAEENMPGLARHFDEIDTNHDGIITIDEMKAVYEKKRETAEQKANKAKENEALLPVDKKRGHKNDTGGTDKPKHGKKPQLRNETASPDSVSSLS
ncbi:MAG TPA: EF-hand domain-containing protein [Novimethylophilus sp.]|jgi:hypothetical protein|uniref:EF-hand domain-containing protein n=1 Tax=Novimethylophilus sp. TaxID=2137426 RepID=UPI002F3ED087